MSDVEVPKSPLTWPVMVAVAVNLIPLIGVIFWGWSAFALIFLYWLENVVIGARTLASMIASGFSGVMNAFGALFVGGFFTLHYGLFCFVHGTFVVALFGGGMEGDSLFDLADTARALFAREPNLLIGFLSIVLWQAVTFVLFLLRGEARDANPMLLMAAPYPRIIVLHISIIFGGFLLMMLNQPVAGLVVLALMKASFDVAEAQGKGFQFGKPSSAEPEAR